MNIVAIVGKPNAGKSTLFNRLISQKAAIVEPTPGVTRDRIYGESEWNGKQFLVIDTGGLIPESSNLIDLAIKEQVEIAIDESDCILFLCDARLGITTTDEYIAKMLRSSGKPTVLVVNKCDNVNWDNESYEFYKLGLDTPYPISALNGRNTGDFLDAIAEKLSDRALKENDTRLKIALVGRPNVGKSSIANKLLGENRSIVTDIPGTTRDAIDSVMKYYGEEILLIDTAGLRKRSQIKENIEMFSTLRTARAIERSDVSVVILDATRGLEEQDKKIINQVDEARKGIILAVNKWDLIEKDEKTIDVFAKKFYEEMKQYSYVPLVSVSALTKQRITKIVELAKQIKERRNKRIPTSELNKVLLAELEATPPPAVRGRDLRINYITQVKVEPPLFAFFCNHPELIPDSYKRFIENKLRSIYDFTGTPISFIFRKKNKRLEK